jgi:hypothetical protein
MKKILLVFVSIAVSFVVLLLALNLYIKSTGLDSNKNTYVKWTLDVTAYSLRYLYWGKSYCQLFKDKCEHPEEMFLTDNIVYIYPDNISFDSKQDCVEILFLGDSFTRSPWTEFSQQYPTQFSQHYSNHNSVCVKQLKLATGGANNDQEFLRFSDVVDEIKPDVLIWQFYENDLWENVKNEILRVDGEKLSRKSSITNFLFIAGFLNQRIPFIRNTALGDYLLYLGESGDVFRQWNSSLSSPQQISKYNQQKIPLLLLEMEKLSAKYDFESYTTLSPLECQYSTKYEDVCNDYFQNFLRQILVTHSNFVSMEPPEQRNILGVGTEPSSHLFNTKQDNNPPGYRHLSPSGNEYFTSVMFDNFAKLF